MYNISKKEGIDLPTNRSDFPLATRNISSNGGK